VQRHFRSTLAWAALVAWLAYSGVSADLIQVFAYANMAAANARTMGATAAVAKAVQDAPCKLCKAAAAVRSASGQVPLAKQEASPVKLKPDADVWTMRLPAREPEVPDLFRPDDVASRWPDLICEVPVPPPKARA